MESVAAVTLLGTKEVVSGQQCSRKEEHLRGSCSLGRSVAFQRGVRTAYLVIRLRKVLMRDTRLDLGVDQNCPLQMPLRLLFL